MQRVLITGSSGLVGSEAVRFYDAAGWAVFGMDNNMRKDFFGPEGDTTWNLDKLREETTAFVPLNVDIRDRQLVYEHMKDLKPELIIHAAAQPSHDLATRIPFHDFDVNAGGTLNLLGAVRKCKGAGLCDPAFVYMSTNKVYGDWPNQSVFETDVATSPRNRVQGLCGETDADEKMPVDQCLHSLFGCSKLAADIYTQEFGKYFGLKTCCFRLGCITGGAHSGVELHGFLAYLFKVAREGGTYTIIGHEGKQVRDNIHAVDVITACEEFRKNPRPGEVYNLGGGHANTCSILEAIEAAEWILGVKMKTEYVDEPRKGDHMHYVTDFSKFQQDYPDWRITRSLEDIYQELAGIACSSPQPALS